MFSARDYAVGLLTQKSDRDKQHKIGASNMSNPCARCLARDMIGDRTATDNRAYLGAKLGTATHLFMGELQEDLEKSGVVIIERKIEIGELSGYGTIKSTPDCAHLEGKTLIDWKSSLRAKSKAMQQFMNMPVSSPISAKDKLRSGELKVRQYIAQGQIYADALMETGIELDNVAITFINRDGTGWFDHPDYEDYHNPNKQRDIWDITVPIDRAYASRLWERTQNIWEGISRDGADPMDFDSIEGCYRCDLIAELGL